MRDPVLVEGSIEIVQKDKIASDLVEILSLDLTTCQVSDFAEFSSDFELEMLQTCQITAIGGCFDTIFAQMKNPKTLSTSPHSKPTHWKQTVFYLEKKISVTQGDKLKGRIEVSRPPKDARGLLVKLMIGGQTRAYDMA